MSETATSRILIAEDNAAIRRALTRFFQEKGYAVEAAEDGLAALKAIERERPDVMLLDMLMPRLDGLGVIREVRARGWDLPIVLLTGSADAELAKRSLSLGARDFLVKPFSFHLLEETVRWHLDARASPRVGRTAR